MFSPIPHNLASFLLIIRFTAANFLVVLILGCSSEVVNACAVLSYVHSDYAPCELTSSILTILDV